MLKQKRVLGTFTLAMITVAAIISLRNLPFSAVYGLSSVFYFIISAFLFFIPIGLVTAELATGWPRAGGNYVWVSEAFGKRWGFVALWIAWMETIAWFPTILAFTAAMLAHLMAPIFPGLEDNKLFYFIVMVTIFWGTTFLNFLGIETSSWFSSLGVITGTLIPGAVIIGFGLWWYWSGHPLQIPMTWDALIPDFRLETMVFFSGILLGLAGVELAVFHIRDAKNPQRDFPRALVLASIVIFLVSILGTLAIAFVVPPSDMSLLSALIQAFAAYFGSIGWTWIVPLFALITLIGSLASINTWTIGPAKGLLVTVEDGFLHPYLSTVNKKGAPTGLLIFQACVGTALSFAFLWMDSHSAAYWVLTALAAQFTVVQYILVFAAVLRLRYSQPQVERPYTVPGGKVGMWVLAIIGITTCLFGFWIVFVPPEQLETGNQLVYQAVLAISFVALTILPVFMALHKHQALKKKKNYSRG